MRFDRSRTRQALALGVAGAWLMAIVIQGAFAQGLEPMVQQKVEAIRQSVASNQAALRQYAWVETTQVSLKGQVRSTTLANCSYGADGKVVKNPIGTQPQPEQRGGFRGRIIARKTEELKEFGTEMKQVLSMYVPPSSSRLKQAIAARKVALQPDPADGLTAAVFSDYAVPGDKVTLVFRKSTRKLVSYDVQTTVGSDRSPVTLSAQFSSLPDGTSHVSQAVLGAPAKSLQVTITNATYTKVR